MQIMDRLRKLGGAEMDTHRLASSDRQQQLNEITTTDADGIANNADQIRLLSRSSLIRFYTVCSDKSDQVLKIFTA